MLFVHFSVPSSILVQENVSLVPRNKNFNKSVSGEDIIHVLVSMASLVGMLSFYMLCFILLLHRCAKTSKETNKNPNLSV